MMNTSFDILLAMTIVNILAWSVLFARFRHYRDSCSRMYLSQLNSYYRKLFKSLRIIKKGLQNKANIESKIASKLAERAFTLASSANLAIMHLQKTLQTQPKSKRRAELIHNEVIQDKVMETVGGSRDYSGFDWLYPILSEEERDIVDTAIELTSKYPKEVNEGTTTNAGDRSTTSRDIR